MVYVLIPAHNNRPQVLSVLRCLQGQRGVPVRILLVDDGSADGTAEEVRREFPAVTVLRGDGTLWWTGANVLGVAHILATAGERDAILLLNNDVTFEENYVALLWRCSEQLGRAVVGSTVVDDEHRGHMVGGLRLDVRLRVTENTDAARMAQTDHDDQVDVLPGRGTLVPVEVFRRIGTFDQRRLPHYGADYEFSIRARRAGFRLAVSHRARVYANLRITGLYPPEKPSLTWWECLALLCSKKSTANLRYYLNYVWLCSEPGHKLRNALSHGVGLLFDTVGKTALGAPIAACLKLWFGGARTTKV